MILQGLNCPITDIGSLQWLHCRLPLWKGEYVPLCRNDFCKCVPAVSGATVNRSIHPAVVWRWAFDLDELHAVLSDSAFGRISVRTFDQRHAEAPHSGNDASDSAGCFDGIPADCPERIVEAGFRSVAIATDPSPAAGDCWYAIFFAVVNRSVDAEVVQSDIDRSVTVAAVRIVEYRIAARSAELSVCV